MNTLKLHLDILDKPRTTLLKKLTTHTKGFILSGGTALALQLGHRKSFDFDFFSQTEIPANLLEKLSQQISIKTVSVDTVDELTFFNSDNIKVTFLQYPFPQIFEPLTLDNNLKIFPVKEISIQKAYTIGRRGEYRDYFDIYSILKQQVISLREIITDAEKKYKEVFNTKLFLQQLVYFDDLLNFDIVHFGHSPLPKPDEIQLFLKNEVKKYLSHSL